MKKRFLFIPALVLPLYAQTVMQVGPYTRPGAEAEVHITDWFPKLRSPEYYLKELSADSVEAQRLAIKLMHNAQDAESFLRLSSPELSYRYETIGVPKNIGNDGLEAVSVAMMLRDVQQMIKPTPTTPLSRDFLLSLRDILLKHEKRANQATGILNYIATAPALSEDELRVLKILLSSRYGITRCHILLARQAQILLQEFQDGKEVAFCHETEKNIVEKYPALVSVLQTERSLRGKVSSEVNRGRYGKEHLLIYLLWQNTEHAIQLARKLQRPGYELLKKDTNSLTHYLSYRGITYYRELGQEVPKSCLSALNVHNFATPEEATATVRKDNADLESELRPLAPRCMLALGGKEADWVPVQVTRQGVHPGWPDASAVTLPMWSPSLLGLENEESATVQAAFSTDLTALEELLRALREEHGAAGILLSAMLENCNRVRPVEKDLRLPVYARIALHFESDGLTVNYDEQSESFGVNCERTTGAAIVEEALNKAPQLLHRITLQLALLEKHGQTQALEKACGQLARVLNRSNLWPLVICQRELRGFSRRALLSLFTHYEGERAALPAYGEAMGMSREMSIATRANEDSLPEWLRHAACLSAADSTLEQKQESAHALLAIAAEKPDSELAADIIAHLLACGQQDKVAAEEQYPASVFRGRYAGSGLLLIRHHLRQNNPEAARKVLSLMEQDNVTNTMPAYRTACALLSVNAKEQKRLRQDALILAMLYHHFDSKVYRDYLADLTAAGEEPDTIMKCELLFSRGRKAGISLQMAERLANAGQWAQAAFCYEYLIAVGISTATPYGLVPTQADIYTYRLLANECHRKARQVPTATSATTPPPAPGKMHPAAAPLAALPPREWKLKDGNTLHGQLLNTISESSPAKLLALRIGLADGSDRCIPLEQLAESPARYITEWEKANGFVHWEWPFRREVGYQTTLHGKPLCAERDFCLPGEYHIRVMHGDGYILRGKTSSLKPEHKKEALSWAAEHCLYPELCIATTPMEALRLAKERGLSVLLLIDTHGHYSSGSYHNRMVQHLTLFPEMAREWSKRYVFLPVASVLYPYEEQRKRDFIWEFDPKLIQQLVEMERAINPSIAPGTSLIPDALEYIRKNSGAPYACIISPQGTTIGRTALMNYPPQPDIFANMEPLNTKK